MQKLLDSVHAFYGEGVESEADAASVQPETTQDLQALLQTVLSDIKP